MKGSSWRRIRGLERCACGQWRGRLYAPGSSKMRGQLRSQRFAQPLGTAGFVEMLRKPALGRCEQ